MIFSPFEHLLMVYDTEDVPVYALGNPGFWM